MDAFEEMDLRTSKESAEWFYKLTIWLWIVTIVIFSGALIYSKYYSAAKEKMYLQNERELNREVEKLTIEKNVLIETKSCK